MKLDRNTAIVTIYVTIDTLCKNLITQPAQKQKLDDAKIITMAICSAVFFHSNHDQALAWLSLTGYFPCFSLSRFNRRVHRLGRTAGAPPYRPPALAG